jgi:hypothetical protein
MKTIMICAATACASLALLAPPAGAFPAMPALPGVPHLPGGPSRGGVSIDVWLDKAERADHLFFVSAMTVFEMVSTKEQIEEIKARQAAIDGVADPKERQSQTEALKSDIYAKLAQVDYDAENQALEKRLDERQRRRLGAAIFNSSVATFIDVQCAAEAPGVARDLQGTFNSGNLGEGARKVVRFREVAGVIGSQAQSWQHLSTGFAKLRSAGKLQALPTSATDQPMAVAD